MKTRNQKPIIDTPKKELQYTKERNTNMLLKKAIKQQPEVNCRCKEMDVCHTLWHSFTFFALSETFDVCQEDALAGMSRYTQI